MAAADDPGGRRCLRYRFPMDLVVPAVLAMIAMDPVLMEMRAMTAMDLVRLLMAVVSCPMG